MTTGTFSEAKHPRNRDGRFAAVTAPASAGHAGAVQAAAAAEAEMHEVEWASTLPSPGAARAEIRELQSLLDTATPGEQAVIQDRLEELRVASTR